MRKQMKKERVYSKVLIGLFACLIVLGLVFVGQIGYAIYQDHQITEVRVAHKAVVKQDKTEDHQHAWATTYTKPATCMEYGEEEKTCLICGKTETIYIQPINHQYGDWEITQKATCAKEGKREAICVMCKRASITEAIPKTDHTYGKWKVVEEATCFKEGKEERICSVCETKESRAIPKTDKHTFLNWQVIEKATCLKEGKEAGTCFVCGKEESRAIPKTNHTYGAWIVTQKATCTKEGTMEQDCIVCGHVESTVIPKAEHNWVAEKIVDGKQIYTCSICGSKLEKNLAEDPVVVEDPGEDPNIVYPEEIEDPVVVEDPGEDPNIIYPEETSGRVSLSSITYSESTTKGSTITAYANGVKGLVSNVVWSLLKSGGTVVQENVASTKRDGETWQTTFNIDSLEDGKYAASANIADAFGDWKTSYDLIGWSHFTIDRTAPSQSVFLDDPLRYTNSGDGKTFRVTAQDLGDNLSGVEGVYLWVSTKANEWNIVNQAKMKEFEVEGKKAWYYDVKIKGEGEYICYINTLDKAGNWAGEGPYETMIVTRTKMQLSSLKYSDVDSKDSTISVVAEGVYGAYAPITNVVWSLYKKDGTAVFTEKESSFSGDNTWGIKFNVADLEDGEYTASAKLIDNLGNEVWSHDIIARNYFTIGKATTPVEGPKLSKIEYVKNNDTSIYAYAYEVTDNVKNVLWELFKSGGQSVKSNIASTYHEGTTWGAQMNTKDLENGKYAVAAYLIDDNNNIKASYDLIGWNEFIIENADPNALSLASISYSESVVKGPTVDAFANGVKGPVKNVIWTLLKAGGEVVFSEVASTYSGEETWKTTFDVSTLENGEYAAAAVLMGDNNNSKASYDLIGWSNFSIDRVPLEHGRFLDDEVRVTNAKDGTTFRVTAIGPTNDAEGIEGMYLWVTTDHQDGHVNSWNKLESVKMLHEEKNGTVQWYYEVPITGEGNYYCLINPKDNVGNWKWGGPVEYMVVERTAPILSSISYSETVTNSSIIFAYADGVKGNRAPVSSVIWNLYKVDGTLLKSEALSTYQEGERWGIGFDIAGLEDGIYTATARLTDSLGNAKWSHEIIGWRYFTIDKQNSLRPKGVETSVTTKQNTKVTGKITMTSNDKIVRVDVVGSPAHGTVTCKSDLTFEYTPETGFYGNDSFKVALVNENNIASNPIKVSVVIKKALNEGDIFKSADTVIRIKMNQTYTTRAFASKDLNYESLTYKVSKKPSYGSVSIVDSRKIEYIPKKGSLKDDSFKIRVSNETEFIIVTFNVYIDEKEVKEEHTWYIRGYEDGTIRPDGTITREELATILYRIDTDSQETIRVGRTAAYTDVSSSRWSYNAIMYLTSLSVLTGYGDGSFRPANPITRAELSAIIARYAKLTDKTNISYSDLSSTHWANDAIAKATQKGYMTGYTTGEFKPDQKLTRAEAITVINRLLERNVEGITLRTSPFIDLSPAHWAFKQIVEATATHTCVMDKNYQETWIDYSYPYLYQ